MINTGSATPRLDLLGPVLQEAFPEEAYVAHHVLPPIMVQKVTGAIPSFLLGNDQVLSIKHADKAEYTRIISQLGQNTYNCTEAGLEESLSFRDYEILGRDMAFELTTRRLVHAVLRARDSALAGSLFSASGETTFATNLVTASNAWSGGAASTGTPFDDVATAKVNIAKQIGAPGNAMLLSYQAYMNVCTNAQIRTAARNIWGYGGEKADLAANVEIPTKALAALFGLDEIIVASGNKNTALEGVTASRSFLWPSTYALVFRKSIGDQHFREAALGRMFVYDLAATFNELATVGTVDMLRSLFVEQYPEPKTNTDVLRVREHIDMQVLLATAGSLIKSI